MRPRQRQSGYVLLLVLVTLALTSLAVAASARQHLRSVAANDRSARELQHRWAVRSLQATVLPRAEDVLKSAEARAGRPVARLTVNLVLNGEPYQIVLADEQAKLNVNAAYQWGGAARVTQTLEALGRDERRTGPTANLLGPASAIAGDDRTIRYASFGQLFPDATAAQLYPGGDSFSPAAQLTCWGYPAVNFRRATPEVLREACRGVLPGGKIEELIRVRDASPKQTVEALLIGLGDTNPRMSPLGQRLVAESWCHSMWIAHRTGTTIRYDWSVRDQTSADRPMTYQFSWQP